MFFKSRLFDLPIYKITWIYVSYRPELKTHIKVLEFKVLKHGKRINISSNVDFIESIFNISKLFYQTKNLNS